MPSQALESIKRLEPQKLLQVRQVAQERLASYDEMRKRQTFYQSPPGAGSVRKIKISFHRSRQSFVQVQGTSITQTIIVDRG
jgi:hypothetical protein